MAVTHSACFSFLDTMDKWDEEKLRSVVTSKGGNPRTTTDVRHVVRLENDVDPDRVEFSRSCASSSSRLLRIRNTVGCEYGLSFSCSAMLIYSSISLAGSVYVIALPFSATLWKC
jgi:hypothetical protein